MLGERFIASMDIVRAGWRCTQRHESRKVTRERFGAKLTGVQDQWSSEMRSYQFSVIIERSPITAEGILGMADALGDAGCLDATICGHQNGAEAVFDRDAESLQDAIHSAVTAIEDAGFKVKRVELERESITAGTGFQD